MVNKPRLAADDDFPANEAETLLAAGMRIAEPLFADEYEMLVRRTDPNGGERVERVPLSTLRPRRKTGDVTLNTVDSLVRYVLRHRTPDSVVYADQEREKITAVLDDHGAEPGHREHRAIYPCPVTVEWDAWRKALRIPMSQEALVDFLEERALEVVQPTGAELQEMLRELHVKADVSWRKAFDERTGTVRLEYKEDVSDASGRAGQVSLPTQFVIGVPVYKGGDPYRCEVRLRYRLNDAKLRLQLSIDNVTRIEEVAFAEAVRELEAGLDGETLVLHGEAPPAE